jgi:hypothetical protein
MLETINQSLLITAFVFVMMLMIEYINVLTSGRWQRALGKRRWVQYGIAVLLGAAPGCLGAFAIVAMYSHGVLSLGAVVAAMIATSGDEAFVMLALIPKQYILITFALVLVGVSAGSITDFFARRSRKRRQCTHLVLHDDSSCECFPKGRILLQWRNLSPTRGILAIILVIILLSLIFGEMGSAKWNWIRITTVSVTAVALFIVGTVPEHFLKEHLWRHIALKHAPRVFLWTTGVLLSLYMLTEYLDVDLRSLSESGKWILLIAVCVVGLIPESGPHLIFVTLFAEGIIPWSLLLASSIVQDGHGMLPMLAHSRADFARIKGINFAAGLILGGAAFLFGF